MVDTKSHRRSVATSFKERAEQSFLPLLGAILLSAAGSLPLHLTPLILVVLIADGRVSIAGAGWVTSAILAGHVFSSLTLPILKISMMHRISVLCAILILLLGLATTALSDTISIYLGWYLVGVSCGSLMYLGTISASHYRRTTFAFSIRLGLVLILAGAVTSGLLVSDALTSYQTLLTALILTFCVICGIGILFYKPIAFDTQLAAQIDRCRWSTPQITGLISLNILFVGQGGFLAYVIYRASDRGMTLADTTWAIVAMKIVAGVWLASAANFKLRTKQQDRLLEFGVLLAIGVATASYTRDPTIFFLSLLIFEIAFNTLSARFQARIAELNRHLAGQWLTAAVLLGAACGPPLHGVALTTDLAFYFLLLSVCSAILPAIWARKYDS